MSPWKLKHIANIVAAGGVIAYPTEAVYGLGCDPLQEAAVMRILQLKRRPVSKGLILIAADVGQILDYIDFTDNAMRERVLASWPGHVTWLLPASAVVPAWISGQHKTVAVRVSRHPMVRDLCRYCGPLVSTSANPARCQPARSARRVMHYFGQRIDYVVHTPTGHATRPSEIRDATTGQIMRSGG